MSTPDNATRSVVVKGEEANNTGVDVMPATAQDEIVIHGEPQVVSELNATRSQDKHNTEPGQVGISGATRLQQRPPLKREASNPAQPQYPPPPPSQTINLAPPNSLDSLSLAQLRQIVSGLPRIESTVHQFVYQDAGSFPEELEEWFSYSEEEQFGLIAAKSTFETKWKAFTEEDIALSGEKISWITIEESKRKAFVIKEIAGLENPDLKRRSACLETLMYIGLGSWGETAGLRVSHLEAAELLDLSEDTAEDSRYTNASLQMKWMMDGLEIISKAGGISAVFDATRLACSREAEFPYFTHGSESNAIRELEVQETRNSLTLMYLLVEAGRRQVAAGKSVAIREDIASLDPSLQLYLVKTLGRLRWDAENSSLPMTKVLLLLWKSILLSFGGTKELYETKVALEARNTSNAGSSENPMITASPLDYHLFRQEITSKYPAYNPPQSVLPLEPENNSILPPLANHPSRVSFTSNVYANGSGSSILHQPVHIATPAPSPPPSPAAGGKAGKKQNYQTNQNFPFLYPPLDSSSNSAGGKGTACLQDSIVRRKWEGSDIPASILEAGDLFSKRVKMTRAIRQLWEERERFMQFERGWGGLDDDEELMKDSITVAPNSPTGERNVSKSFGIDSEISRRLDGIEEFYGSSLPFLQSFVIVLLKNILANVMQPASRQAGPTSNGLASGFQSNTDLNSLNQSRNSGKENNGPMMNGLANTQVEGTANYAAYSLEEIDLIRNRERLSKAITSCLLFILKWFKVSHVLKFEYMTQLLLDSNYIQLVLRLVAHEDLDEMLAANNDRPELSFFTFCQTHSQNRSLIPTEKSPVEPSPTDIDSDSDDAAPPPIKRSRSPPSAPSSSQPPPAPSLIDEMNYPPTTRSPTTLRPLSPSVIRDLTSILQHLRIVQKITKRSSHRALMLIQFKSSTYLKKLLRLPSPLISRYVLKMFKSQTPYCGRKWRQSNMRVITQVYLEVKPELRDEWLAGGDVEEKVEESLPRERAIRSLTHWSNLRRYGDVIAPEGLDHHKEASERGTRGKKLLEEEMDFFRRELEALEIEQGSGEDMMADETGDYHVGNGEAFGMGEAISGDGGRLSTQGMQGW